MQRRTPRPKPSGPDRRKRRFEERDRRIQEVATALFVERGLGGFSMEDVAAAIDYSKGTVYLHYKSKEDVLVAVLAGHVAWLADRFEHAATLPLSPRARMRAIAEIDIGRTIAHPPLLLLATAFVSPATLAKAPPERQQAISESYRRQNAVEGGIVREAISRGDLTLPPGGRPDRVTYALSAMYFGSLYIAAQGSLSQHFTLEQTKPSILANIETVLDGLRWRPPADSPEYQAEIVRLLELLAAQEPAR